METGVSRVTSKGQVVIPKKLRQKYSIEPSCKIRWIEKGDGILMVPESENPIKAAKGMLKGAGLLKSLAESKKQDKQKEQKKRAKRT